MSPISMLRLRSVFIALVVLAISGGAVLLQSQRGPEGDAEAGEPELEAVGTQAELLGKIIDGFGELSMPRSQLSSQIEPLEKGPLSERLAHAVLVGEIFTFDDGATKARELELSDDEKAAGGEALRDAVAAMLDARAAGGDGAAAAAAVDAERLAVVDAKLGYFSRMLKEETAVEAVRAVVVLLSVVGWYTVVFLGGSVGLVVLMVFLASGRTRATLAPASDLRVGVVLGETFVLWFALFLGLTVAMQFVGGGLGTEGRLVLSLFAMFASLAALAYPIMRGIPAAELRRAIGLHAGTGLLREAGWGALCYLTAVPLLAVGLAMFALLSWISTQVFGEQAEPSHPAVEMLADSSALRIVLLYTLASVAAPIVEEIAFRGVFYGHLRAVFAPHRRLLSAFVAAAFSSFVFAVIHPQGVLFVPALGGLAIGFCLYREWRSSLVAPMVAHGINNAVTMTIGLLLLS